MARICKPSARRCTAIFLYFAISFFSIRLEAPVLHAFVSFLKTHFHVNFHVIFGPKPAVPVNLLTAIVVVRSIFVVILTWAALKISKMTWVQGGFSPVAAMQFYGAGSLAAFAAMTSLIALIYISGGMTFDGIRLSGIDRVSFPLRWLIGMALVGFEEESGGRGFGLLALAVTIGEVPAALITSGMFAFAHMGNSGENVLGLLQTFVFAMLCALTVFRTGSIWWAVAFHGVWDWAEECFYGTIGSGSWFDGHLLQLSPRGSHWISGGSAGPEGSVYVFLVLGVLLIREVRDRAHPRSENNIRSRPLGIRGPRLRNGSILTRC